MSDSRAAVQSLSDQWRQTFKLLRRSIECFDDSQWMSGISSFEIPSLVAYHTLQCLVFYFRKDQDSVYRDIPPRFGKDWWQLERSEWPVQADVAAFLDEVEKTALETMDGLSDGDLSAPFPGFGTVLGNITYALRHTMHHQGGLNVLSVHHGIDADLWDQD